MTGEGDAAPKPLAIVVPYRDRAQHLAVFLPHLCAYFSRDVLARRVPVRVLVVEQDPEHAFNSGMCKNIGFRLLDGAAQSVCFHDVDYLPIWADYAPSDGLAGIVWYGAESRPIVPGRPERAVHNLDHFFGGAVIVDPAAFAAVNGYATDYWGWGSEDMDLPHRFRALGLPTSRRRGTFNPLDHVHAGYRVDGARSEAALRNARIFKERWGERPGAEADLARARLREDGLSSLRFDVLRRRALPPPDTAERDIPLEQVTVKLHRPAGA